MNLVEPPVLPPASPGLDPLHPASVAARVARWEREGVQGPLTLELYPTLACNLSCAFCDTTDRHRAPVGELSAARLVELLVEAAELGVKRVFVLGGGEPLLRKDVIAPLLARVKALGMEGILTTNGTLLGPALAAQLLDTGWDEVHVSLDGPNAQIHDRLRGVPGAFRRTVQNTCRLSVARRARGLDKTRVALHFVLTRLNYQTLPEMICLAAALGAFRVDFDALIAYRPEQLALRLRPDEARALPDIAARGIREAERLGILTTLHHFLDPGSLDRGQTVVSAPPGAGLKGAPCLKAWHYLVVQADGKSSPCCVLAGEGGSVAERPLADLWRDDPFLNRVRGGMLDQKPLPRCRECSQNILSHEALIRSYL